jgi:hypothetical protein
MWRACFAETLDDGNDGCVDKAQVRISVAIHKLPSALVVGALQVLYAERATGNIVE